MLTGTIRTSSNFLTISTKTKPSVDFFKKVPTDLIDIISNQLNARDNFSFKLARSRPLEKQFEKQIQRKSDEFFKNAKAFSPSIVFDDPSVQISTYVASLKKYSSTNKKWNSSDIEHMMKIIKCFYKCFPKVLHAKLSDQQANDENSLYDFLDRASKEYNSNLTIDFGSLVHTLLKIKNGS